MMLERLSMVMSCSGSARFLASEAVTHLKYDLLRVALRGISNMLQSARNLREVFGFHVLDCIHDETVDAGTAENVRG